MPCSPEQHLKPMRLTLEVRDEYPCWRCGQPMAILLVFPAGKSPSERYGPGYGAALYDSLFAYERPPGLISVAAKVGVQLKWRGSRTVGQRYIQHMCPQCGANQGDYYVVDDRHPNTRFQRLLRATWCAACDNWDVQVDEPSSS